MARYDDARIRFHRFGTHVPIDESFNRTAMLTSHDWIQLLCSDDRLRPGCLARLAEAITTASASLAERGEGRLTMALTACRRVDAAGRPADRIWYGSKNKLPARDGLYDPKQWFDLLMQDGHPPWNFGSIAVARSVVEESGGFFRPEVGLSSDVEMVLRAGAYGHVVYVSEPLLDFTVRSEADNAMRLWANRAKGSELTPLGAALLAAVRVQEHRRGLTPTERRAAAAAIARSHLQRAAQHRVLPDGRGRLGAWLDLRRAFGYSARTVLSPWHLAYAIAALAFPASVLRAVQRRLAARHPA